MLSFFEIKNDNSGGLYCSINEQYITNEHENFVIDQ